MKRKVYILFVLSLLACSASAQGYMATKTRLDSLKINKFHGEASLSGKVEQTDNFKFELDAAFEGMIPFKRHKLRFAANVAFNFINQLDNGNKGFAYISGDFYQYEIRDKITGKKVYENGERSKNLLYFSAIGGGQYDFCRDLTARVFGGFMLTFQPLRNHNHLCIEPSVGILADFQYWNVLGKPELATLRNYFNDSPAWLRHYLTLDPAGYAWQIDPSLGVGINFMGEWDKVAFNIYTLVLQPFKEPFDTTPELEDDLRAYYPEFAGLFNTKPLPQVSVDATLEVGIYKLLSLVVGCEFLWDGGQLPSARHDVTHEGQTYTVGARNMRYCCTLGFKVHW